MKNVADPVQVLDDRDAGLVDDSLDEPFPSPRDDDVHELLEPEQLPDGPSVGGLDDLDRVGGQGGLREPRADALRNRPVGVDRLRAAPEDRRIARLEAEPTRVRGHVRA